MSDSMPSFEVGDVSVLRLPGKVVLRDLFDAGKLARLTGWRAFREGVDILPLYGKPGEEAAPSAALLRYSPGARVPLHTHAGYEHIIVLDGAQQDADGQYPAGTCVISEPGSQHRVASETGCLVLAIWNRPVRFAADGSGDGEVSTSAKEAP